MTNAAKRNEALDILRIFALLCVVIFHFMFNSGLYFETVTFEKTFLWMLLRSLVNPCVPLFIMLTGYLMSEKTASLNYCLGLGKNMGAYVACSLVYVLFNMFWLLQKPNFGTFLIKLLNFEGTPYAWYLEMYAGLYLLIPFLNHFFNGLKDKKQAIGFLSVLFLVVCLPGLFNSFNFEAEGWWTLPGSSEKYTQILPDWWANLYPILYYFMGSYLKKYKCELKTSRIIFYLALSMLFSASFDFFHSYGYEWRFGPWNTAYSPIVTAVAFFIFTLFLRIKFKKENIIRGRILKALSDSCLCAYLLSGICEAVFNRILRVEISTVEGRLSYAPIIILAVFAGSLLGGYAVNTIYKNLIMLCSGIWKKIRTKSEQNQKKGSSINDRIGRKDRL